MLSPDRAVHVVRGRDAGLHPGISVRSRRQEPELGFLHQAADAGGRNRRRHGQRHPRQRASCCCWRLLIGVPIGFLGGVYLAEFGGTTFSFVVRYVTDLLNGVPSIVIGIFAYTLIVLPQKHFSTLAGGLALGVMMIPIAIRSSEEFLRAVPLALREGAMALGASKSKAILTVVIPAAKNGIITGIMLNLARVAGETAPLLFTSFGNRSGARLGAAHRLASGDDFYLRHRALRGLAPAGLGRRFRIIDSCSCREYCRAPDSFASRRTFPGDPCRLPARQPSTEINMPVRNCQRAADGGTSRPRRIGVQAERDQSEFFYGTFQALHGISMQVYANRVTAFIGPSGCGKSTFLRTLNRMNETVRHSRVEGEILLDGENIFDLDVSDVRRRVGMVFQKSNPFPKSIFDNIAYGPRINGYDSRAALRDRVEQSLRRAALWDEVKDKLHQSAYGLSGGQQQRLCIARALAVNPEVLLLDEPCSALDPIATAKIEDLIFQLKNSCTIVIVTHNMQQAARVADYTGFFLMGQLIEFDNTTVIFKNPAKKETEDYVTGRFG